MVEISSELASVPMWNRYAEFILSKKRTDFPKFANELGGVTENISFETLKNLMINELVNENYYEFIYLLAFSKTDRDRLIGLIKAGLIKDNIDYDSQPSYIVDNFFNEEGINFNYLIKYITFFDRDRIGISKINKYLPSINLEINLDLNTNIVTEVLENDWILLKFNRMIKNDGSFDNLTLFEDEKHEIIQRYRKGLFPDNLFNYPKNIKDQFINNLENDFINNEEIDIPIVKKIPDDYNPILELAQKRAQEIREGRL